MIIIVDHQDSERSEAIESAKRDAAYESAKREAAELAERDVAENANPKLRVARLAAEKEAENARVADEKAAARRKLAPRIAAAEATLIKNAMRNPDSFKLTQVGLMKNGSSCFEYRAQNGFGGLSVGEAVYSSPTGRLKTDEMDGFVPLWNKECTQSGGIIITDEVLIYMR